MVPTHVRNRRSVLPMNLPSVAADVRRLKPLGREGRSEPPDVGCYQGWVMAPMRIRNRRLNVQRWKLNVGSSSVHLLALLLAILFVSATDSHAGRVHTLDRRILTGTLLATNGTLVLH